MPLELIIREIEEASERVRLLHLALPDNSALPVYTAGAHIDVVLDGIGTRSYSLIDFETPATNPLSYHIAVQREDDGLGGSKAMHELAIGDVLHASEPKNSFELVSDEAPVVLLAGGIGVTPLISMASSLRRDQRLFEFHYSARSHEAMAFASRLSTAHPAQLSLYLDDENALSLDKLFESIKPSSQLYICGPAAMIEAARNAALAVSIPANNIHVELFSTPVSDEGDQPFEVELQSTGQVFTVPAGQTILDVLEAADVDVMFDCQRGDCGICQTGVISGTPDHRDVVLSVEERESGEVMQICVSRAFSDRLVLDL